MKEKILINGQTLECELCIGSTFISFTTAGTYQSIKNVVKDATELKIIDGDSNPYGEYANLTYQSITENTDGNVTVNYNLMSDTDARLKALEDGQEIQDQAIVELAEMLGEE